ncbi:protein-tyrosine-phosphatase [Caldalkalibacillus thermarum]|uniref:low molecular weight protein arginine phosphatase n=1 Tax=Caldalkalibacillus thermarum TaxID=296745 RepID=UPI0016690A17|nr:low molecular weight protein arginine phosphatase [Caldalkalibacillus thermarum]GGK25854.1 protein-tyrosine-phosphatase [Caldalkalibacillus thermarum]
MKHILFVCTGNTCRSPMAEYLLRHKAGEQYEVKSAGLAALPGQDASGHVKQLLSEQGITVEHQSQMVTPELMEWADLVLTMTEAHTHRLKEQFPDKRDIIFTLKAYVDPDHEDPNISDPFGGDKDVYAATLKEIDEWLDRFVQKDGRSD